MHEARHRECHLFVYMRSVTFIWTCRIGEGLWHSIHTRIRPEKALPPWPRETYATLPNGPPSSRWQVNSAKGTMRCLHHGQRNAACGPDGGFPGKRSFLIDVKGQRRSSFWQVKEREEIRDDLFYVLAFVPPNKPNRYFVLSHGDVHGLIEDYKTSGVKYDPRFPGFNWTDCHGFEDQWGRLPE